MTPYFEKIQQKVSLKELRCNLEKLTGHSLNQWGISESVSSSLIIDFLSEKLEPITQEVCTNLRKEALAISFLEYAESSNSSGSKVDEY